MLYRITFTGADDKTNPLDLADISARYPFVEWGILIGSRMSVPRMPSKKWIEDVLGLKRALSHSFQLSLHVCGAPLRTIAAGRSIIGEGGGQLCRIRQGSTQLARRQARRYRVEHCGGF